jgi:Secretion system C-terminal sorting domain
MRAYIDAIYYKKVANVAGAGTTSIAQQYAIIDESIRENSYYKLVQTDFDSKTETFYLSAKVRLHNCYTETVQEISAMFPNPNNTDALAIRFFIEDFYNEKATVYLYDIMGKEVSKQAITIQAGANAANINLNGLPTGTYMLQIYTHNWVSEGKRLIRIQD